MNFVNEEGTPAGGGPGPPDPYGRLDPALRRLRAEHLRIWGEARTRELALREIAEAYASADEGRLATAVRRVDEAVVAGLAALGLPRGPVSGIEVREFGGLWLGRVVCQGLRDLRRVRWVRRRGALATALGVPPGSCSRGLRQVCGADTR